MRTNFRPIPTKAKQIPGRGAAQKRAPRALYVVETGLLGLAAVGYVAMQLAQQLR